MAVACIYDIRNGGETGALSKIAISRRNLFLPFFAELDIFQSFETNVLFLKNIFDIVIFYNYRVASLLKMV